MISNNSPASNVRMCTAIGLHNRTLPTVCTLPQTIPAQPSIKALAIKALGRTTERTSTAHCTKAVPTIPAICRMLQIDWPEVDRQMLLDDEDLLLYAMGKYTLRQITLFLVSWELFKNITPFPLVSDSELFKYIEKLPIQNRNSIFDLISKNIKEISGGDA